MTVAVGSDLRHTKEELKVANARIDAFTRHFGNPHRYLAYHAAFPLALTPQLVYRLWANFQNDADGDFLNIPYIAVADLLLSGICDEVGYELFQMDQIVRDQLLEELAAHPRFGPPRLKALAHFVELFVEHQLDTNEPAGGELGKALRWTARPYKSREAASNVAREVDQALQKLSWDDGRKELEIGRLSQLLLSVGQPLRLAGHGDLIDRSHIARYWTRGQTQEAVRLGKELKIAPAGSDQEGIFTLPAAYFQAIQKIEPAQEVIEPVEPPARGAPIPALFDNFDLFIRQSSDGSYYVRSRGADRGEVMERETYIDLDEPRLNELLEALEHQAIESEELVNLGRMLRHALFPGQIWSHFVSLYVEAKRNAVDVNGRISRGNVLHLRLHIEASELSALPWEYCFDDDYNFLALRRDLSITRYTLSPDLISQPQPSEKLKLLVATSQPADQSPLDLEREINLIQQALSSLVEEGRLEIRVLSHATLDSLQQTLVSFAPDIFHFSGHGNVNDRISLILEDETGNGIQITADQLTRLLRNWNIRLAILNTSHSGHGLTQALVRAGIPAAIGMQSAVSDVDASRFAQILYTFIASGMPLDQAMTEMRIRIFSEDNASWGIPILYSQLQDIVLWQPIEKTQLTEQVRLAHPGNVIPPDSLNYVVREVEGRIYGKIAEGAGVVTVIAPHRSGKTSLLRRMETQAKDNLGWATAYVNLAALSGQNNAYWIRDFASQLARYLNLEPATLSLPNSSFELPPFLNEMASRVPQDQILILLDEVGAIPPDVRSDFFQALRAYFQQIALPPSEGLSGYSLLIASTIDPDSFIQNRNVSPFNIAQVYRLPDFTLDEMASLFPDQRDIYPLPDPFVKAAYDWTNGQPYLSHLLAASLTEALDDSDAAKRSPQTAEQVANIIDSLARELLNNSQTTGIVRQGIANDEREALLREILMGSRFPFSQANESMADLERIGLLVADEEGICQIRNRVYELALRNTLFPIGESPVDAYTGPILPVKPFRGLHGRSERHPRPADIEAFQRGKFNAILVQSGISSEEIQAYQADFILCRIFERFTDTTLSPHDFISQVEENVNIAYQAGVRYFVAGNEPNIDYQNPTIVSGSPETRSGKQFAEWLLEVHKLLRNRFPGIRLGWPALSPGEEGPVVTGTTRFRESDNIFLKDARNTDIFADCDFISLHAYWSSAKELDKAVNLVQQYREKFPDKLLFVTEATNPNGPAAAELGRQMAEFYRRLDGIPGVGAFFFLVSGPGWSHTALVDEDGSDRGVIQGMLGDVDKADVPSTGTTSPSDQVFLIFARPDYELADKLRTDLDTFGINVWISDRLEPSGPDFQQIVENAIASSAVVVVLLSPEAKDSEWVVRELSYAKTFNKPIFPVLVSGDERSAVPLSLITTQYVDLRETYQDGLTKLANAIQGAIGRDHETPPDQVPEPVYTSAIPIHFQLDSDGPPDLHPLLIYQPFGVRTLKLRLTSNTSLPALHIRPRNIYPSEREAGTIRGYADETDDFQVLWGSGHEDGLPANAQDYFSAFERPAPFEPGQERFLYFHIWHKGPDFPATTPLTIEAVDESGQILAALPISLRRPSDFSSEVIRLISAESGRWQTISGRLLPRYDSVWWPETGITYETTEPLSITIERQGNELHLLWADKKVPSAIILDQTKPTILDYEETLAFDLFYFNEHYIALRVWLFWLDTKFGGQLFIGRHEVPDVARFDFLIRRRDGLVTLTCTDIHWREVWNFATHRPLKVSLGIDRARVIRLAGQRLRQAGLGTVPDDRTGHYNPLAYIRRLAEKMGNDQSETPNSVR